MPIQVDKSISWSSVGGLDKHVTALKEMVTLPLLYPEVFERFHITAPRGVIFHGPPGTGKTLVARALANSCSRGGQHVSFFMRKGADCLSKWVGEAERQLRLLFEQARQHQPSIIFFDEIDGLAPVRSSKQDQIHASIVSTLLALMDGLDDRGQVIVIGATNRIDSIDPALRRPGRFDRELLFGLPDKEARREILDIHTQHWNPPLLSKFKDDLAEECVGYCGADLKSLCAEASLIALRRRYPQVYSRSEKLCIDVNKIIVTREDFLKALNKVVPASQRSVSTYRVGLKNTIKPLLSKALYDTLEILRDIFPLEKCKVLRKRFNKSKQRKVLALPAPPAPAPPLATTTTTTTTTTSTTSTTSTLTSNGNTVNGTSMVLDEANKIEDDTINCNDVLPDFDPESPEEMRLLYGVDNPLEIRNANNIAMNADGTAAAAATITTTTTTIPKFVVGQRVRARYNKGQGNYYVANITTDNGDGTYNVLYNDGDKEDNVKAEFIHDVNEPRSPKKKAGQRKIGKSSAIDGLVLEFDVIFLMPTFGSMVL